MAARVSCLAAAEASEAVTVDDVAVAAVIAGLEKVWVLSWVYHRAC
jgi:hypothetical protein